MKANAAKLELRQDNLSGQEIAGLLQEHLEDMHHITPPESVHALDLEALRTPDITFWTIWENGKLLGCGALKELDSKTGEIKSMRTTPAYRRRGVAKKMLAHIVSEAERRGYDTLSLETGAMPEFTPARSLYLRHGFEVCGPFAEYQGDPNSVFMTKKL